MNIDFEIYQILLSLGYVPEYPPKVHTQVEENGYIIRYPFRRKDRPSSLGFNCILCLRIEKDYKYNQLRTLVEQKVLEALDD